MLNRTSALWLVVGILAAYTFVAPSVEAQNPTGLRPPFVAIGDIVTLRFERGTLVASDRDSIVQCVVTALQDMWVRCGPEDKFAVQQEQRWYSFQRVVEITKRER